jgi:hypothetical protein
VSPPLDSKKKNDTEWYIIVIVLDLDRKFSTADLYQCRYGSIYSTIVIHSYFVLFHWIHYFIVTNIYSTTNTIIKLCSDYYKSFRFSLDYHP